MDFKNMSIADLRQYAKDKGLRGVSALKKPELVDLLEKVEMMTGKNSTAEKDIKVQATEDVKNAIESCPTNAISIGEENSENEKCNCENCTCEHCECTEDECHCEGCMEN